MVGVAIFTLSLAVAGAAPACAPQTQPFDAEPARAALARLAPASYARQFRFVPIQPRGGKDVFRITGRPGDIKIEGSSNGTLLTGFNWYLKYVAHGQISVGGYRVPPLRVLPAPPQTIERVSPYTYRYALNENMDGYSAPYWHFARWQREIDLLAASGINQMLVERGAARFGRIAADF